MQPNTANTPATAQPLKAQDTGAAPQAITANPDASALEAYTLASIAHLEASAALYRAQEAEARAHAAAHQADPFLAPPERLMLALLADNRGDDAAERAQAVQRRADGLRAGGGIKACAPAPMAVIVLTIQRDRIQQTARLVMGSTQTISRSWDRNSANAWRSRDPEWSAAEDRIGVELCEFMDALSLPDRVANMLPRLPAAKASSTAGQEVSNG